MICLCVMGAFYLSDSLFLLVLNKNLCFWKQNGGHMSLRYFPPLPNVCFFALISDEDTKAPKKTEQNQTDSWIMPCRGGVKYQEPNVSTLSSRCGEQETVLYSNFPVTYINICFLSSIEMHLMLFCAQIESLRDTCTCPAKHHHWS